MCRLLKSLFKLEALLREEKRKAIGHVSSISSERPRDDQRSRAFLIRESESGWCVLASSSCRFRHRAKDYGFEREIWTLSKKTG